METPRPQPTADDTSAEAGPAEAAEAAASERAATDSTAAGAAGAAGRVASPPYPIEIALADGTVLRGIEHPADGPPLLFVHDLGDDLDAWGSLASTVRSDGFRVIRLELRGHGLSDGDPDPSATVSDLKGALAEVTGAFGPVGLVVYGAAARASFELGTGHGAPVHAVISPTPGPGDGDRGEGVSAMRVLFTGAHDESTHDYVRTVHSSLRGQNMWISTGTVLRGPALMREHPHLVEQLVTFMRRNLTGYHLAWIAEQAAERPDSDE